MRIDPLDVFQPLGDRALFFVEPIIEALDRAAAVDALPGVAAVSQSFNLILLLAALSALQATLTLPGIAGIVLTIGMAVDANVLIYARIREEIRNGMTVPRAIEAGFDRAFVTIVDANLTTLIVAIVLFSIGTGPVKGFAVTLSLGILTSMFTAVLITQVLVAVWFRVARPKKLPIAS